MAKSKQPLQEVLANLWKSSKKDFEKMTKETSVLLKKGEEALKDVSQKSHDTLEAISATLKKEKLFYELGKCSSAMPKSKWSKNKKISSILKEISKLDKIIKKSKKKK